MAELEKCIKCNKNTRNEFSYDVPIIRGKDKDGEWIKKLEGGTHCLDCWKQVEKDYRWYFYMNDIPKTYCGRSAGNYYFNRKSNQWCNVDGGSPDPDVPISPNDKIPNYWVGCWICSWERELKDDEVNALIKCGECKVLHGTENDKIEVYPADKRKSIIFPKCSKCKAPVRENQECGSCLNVKKLFERNQNIKQVKLESDGSLSLLQNRGWKKINAYEFESMDKFSEGAYWKVVRNYLQRINGQTLTYENGELVLDKEDVGGGVKTPPRMERVMFCG